MSAIGQNTKFHRIFLPALAWMIALIFFFPIFWMVLTSFKTDADAVKPEFLFMFTPTLDNYLNMTENYDYWRFAKNSIITAVFATVFTLFVGVPAAYAMAFNPSRHTKDIFGLDAIDKDATCCGCSLSDDVFNKNYLGIFDTHFFDHHCS